MLRILQAGGKTLFFTKGWKCPFSYSKLGTYSLASLPRGLERVEGIAAILQEFWLNESTSRGIAANAPRPPN
ncbi:hypothetical protein J27TS7_19620 [Paenibacillus dendritiformis]|nr:hypothetical protein J27TS7_19620 [Paenibacillus dendritiformis]